MDLYAEATEIPTHPRFFVDGINQKIPGFLLELPHSQDFQKT